MCSVAFSPFLIFKAFTTSSPFIHVTPPPTCPTHNSLGNTAAARDRTLSRPLQPSCSLPSTIVDGPIPEESPLMPPHPPGLGGCGSAPGAHLLAVAKN